MSESPDEAYKLIKFMLNPEGRNPFPKREERELWTEYCLSIGWLRRENVYLGKSLGYDIQPSYVVTAPGKVALRMRGGQPEPKITDQHMVQVAQAVGDDIAAKVLVIARRTDLSADTRMRMIAALDERYKGKKSPEWAALLGVSDAAIRQTDAWKEWRAEDGKTD